MTGLIISAISLGLSVTSMCLSLRALRLARHAERLAMAAAASRSGYATPADRWADWGAARATAIQVEAEAKDVCK